MSIFQRLVTALVSPCAPHIVRNLMSVAEKMNLKKMTISRYMCMDSAIYIVHVYVHIYIYIFVHTKTRNKNKRYTYIQNIAKWSLQKLPLATPYNIFEADFGGCEQPQGKNTIGAFFFSSSLSLLASVEWATERSTAPACEHLPQRKRAKAVTASDASFCVCASSSGFSRSGSLFGSCSCRTGFAFVHQAIDNATPKGSAMQSITKC